MNYRVLSSSNIDAQKWNDCVQRYAMDIYNEYHFLNAVCPDHWFGFVWGDYEKILPFYQKKKWGFIPYICMPPFCQKFDNKALSAGEWQEAFTCLKSNNLMLDYAVIENKNKENWEIRKNYILNKTNKTTQEIKDNYSGLLKKNLKRANSELSLDIEFSHTAMETFLSSLPLFQSLVLDKFAHVFWKLKRTHLKFYYAIDVNTNQALATLMYVKYSKKAYLLFPYTSEEGKKRQAMSFLINALVEDDSIEIVDFEGSNIDSIANFYAQFGAVKQEYWTIHWKKSFFPYW
jgi:hypothetical protein